MSCDVNNEDSILQNHSKHGHITVGDSNRTDISLDISFNEDYKLSTIDFFNSSGFFMHQYYYDGRLVQEIRYKDSLKDGNLKEWFENGVISMEANYIRDTLNGSVIFYYKSGTTKVQMYYNMGVESGKWTYWKENGDVDTIIDKFKRRVAF